MHRTIFPIMLLLSMSLAGGATAIPPRPPGSAPPGPGAGGPPPRIAERMKQLRKRILEDEIGLDAQRAAKVSKILESFDATRRKARQRAKQARRALRQLVRSDSDDQEAFRAAIDEMQAANKATQVVRVQQFTALKKLLTPKQQAKLLLALGRLKKRARGFADEFRRGRGGPPGPQPGPGMRRHRRRGGPAPPRNNWRRPADDY